MLCQAYAAPAPEIQESTAAPRLVPQSNRLDTLAVPDEVMATCSASLYRDPADLQPCMQAIEIAPDGNAAQQVGKARLQSALALQYAKRGDLVQARLNINNALHRAPTDWVVRAHEGNIYIYESEFAAALAAFDDALRAAPSPPPALFLNRSLALRALGQYDAAQLDYQRFIDARQAPQASR